MSRPHQYSVCVCLLLAAIIGLHLGVLALLFQRAAHSTDSTQHLLSDYSHLRSSVGGSLLHHEGHSSGGSSERCVRMRIGKRQADFTLTLHARHPHAHMRMYAHTYHTNTSALLAKLLLKHTRSLCVFSFHAGGIILHTTTPQT